MKKRKHLLAGSECSLLRRILRIMKLTTIILLITNMMVSASVYSQSARLTLKYSNISYGDMFQEIEEQSEFRFAFSYSKLDPNQKIQVSINNGTLEKILDETLPGNITYEIIDRYVVIMNADQEMTAKETFQQKIISGKVTDSGGQPLPGVTIVIKGTSQGTVTNVDGNYSLSNVSDDATLVFSFVGMRIQEVAVKSHTNINITMFEETIGLEEVVAVGYGVQRKSDVTGSISVVTAEDLLNRPQFNALEGLRGKAAGVNILSSTGNPLGLNGSGPRIIIRGMNSLYTSSDPLYVVDGVQMTDIQYLNPNDIESIEVLKDASSTAIYGARGANGVLLVTTKRGNVKEGKIVVSYNGYVSLGILAKKVDLMNSEEFVKMEDIAFANLSKYPAGRKTLSDKGLTEWIPRRTDPAFFDGNGNPLYDTDWQEETTRLAISHSHQLNVQSQNSKAAVGGFVNYTDQQGIMINNYAKRLNARLTLDAKPRPWIDINMNLLVNSMKGNTIDDTGGGARRNMWEMPPIIPVKFPDGDWGTVNRQTELDYNLEGMSNPVQELETATRDRRRTKIFGNFAFVFHIIDGLDLKTQFGIDYNISSNRDYLPTDLLYLSAPQGRASLSNGTNTYWQEETFLSYNKVFKDIHRINATLGTSWSESKSLNYSTGNVSGFTSDKFLYYNLGAGSVPSAPSSSASSWAINSYFSRLSYALKDKYMLTLTLRADGSSRFGSNHKYGLFPSGGLGWNISNEDFLKDYEWLSNLKLHTSYGRTGNTEIDVYRSLSMMQSSTTLLNGSRVSTSQMSRMANPDLEWEKTDQFDVGINLGLFDNRINLDFDFYHKNTHDLLLERPIPYETGFSSVYENMGRVDNTGIDLLLRTVNIKATKFKWETTINLNHNKNEIKKLGENNEDIIMWAGVGGGRIIQRVGEPLGSFYTPLRLGTWSTDEKDEAAAASGVQSPGESKKSRESEIIGNGMPKYSGSLINSFYYGPFDLTVDLQFSAGVKVWEAYLGAILDRAGVANGMTLMLTDGWTEERQNTMVQQIRHTTFAGQSSSSDSYWVADGSYIRGNLLQLGYTFNKKRLAQKGIQNIRINCSITNAFLIHSKEFKGYDPESSARSGKWGQNIFFYQYPRERTFTIGANIIF